MTRYAIGLGSNLGDRRRHLWDAHRELSDRFDILAVSSLYETAPVGGPEQDPFLNAVVLVKTDAAPPEVLSVCQDIERLHHRERTVRWGPRTLDLDILATDGGEYRDDRLTLPHPRALEREFVLRPLSEVWPEAPLGGGLAAAGALERVGDQGVDLLSSDWLPPISRWKSNALLAGQFALIAAVALAFAYDGSLPDGEVSVTRVVGGLVAFLGAVLAFVSSRRLGPSMTPGPIPKQDAELITSGPYRYARHPIYGGVSLFLMGTALLLDSLVGFSIAAALIPYFILKTGYEERQLRMRFAGYLLYKQTVSRRFIPFVG